MDKAPSSSCDDASKKASKRKKTGGKAEDGEYVPREEGKGGINQRVWSESDVIKLLRALKEQGNVSDVKRLFQTVHPCLDANVTQRQVADKVRKLKKKFMDSKGKEVENDNDTVYKLSKQLWGGGGRGEKKQEQQQQQQQQQQADDNDDDDEVDLFRTHFPNVDHCVRRMYSEVNLSEIEFQTCIDSTRIEIMNHIGIKELDDLEEEWIQYNLEGIERGNKRMKLMNKLLMLLDKANI